MSNISPYQPIQLENVMEVNPPTINSQMVVRDMLARMNQNHGGNSCRYSYALVTEKSRLIGILTERDIVKLTAAEIDLAATTVEQVMTTNLITFKQADFINIHSLLAILRENQIRHLPIVDDLEQLVGIVSIESISQALHPSNLLRFHRVDEAIISKIISAPPTASVLSLSQMMAETRSSCVVIVESQAAKNITESISKPIGIVTERDVVQFQILELDFAKTTAQTVMSHPLVCIKRTDSLIKVWQHMEKLRVRRLVVTGDQEELQGIINQSSLLQVLDPKELIRVIETLQRELEEQVKQLQEEKELAQVTLQSIGDAVITTNNLSQIVNINPMAEHLTGWREEEAKGKPLFEVFHQLPKGAKVASSE